MRTTVEVPDTIFREVKAKAAREGISLKLFFIRAIERELNPPQAAAPVRLKFPLIHQDVDPATLAPALTNRQLNELLDAQDVEHLNAVSGRR